MNRGAFGWLMAAAAVAALSGEAPAQEVDVGKAEFLSSCASCHGADAKGDGPVAAALKRRPADLTALAKNNNGVFPVQKIYRVIDGRDEIAGHGSREMPIWGYRFVPPSNKNLKVTEDFIVAPPASAEGIIYGRIMAVIDYLNRVQQK